MNWIRAWEQIPKHNQRVIVWPKGYSFPFVGVFQVLTPLQMGKSTSVANAAAALWMVSDIAQRPDDIRWMPLGNGDNPWHVEVAP